MKLLNYFPVAGVSKCTEIKSTFENYGVTILL